MKSWAAVSIPSIVESLDHRPSSIVPQASPSSIMIIVSRPSGLSIVPCPLSIMPVIVPCPSSIV